MNHVKRILSVILAAVMILALGTTAFAADTDTAVIDAGRTADLTVYKYDITRAEADGVWDRDSYVSTGIYDQAVNDVLGDPGTDNHSGTNNFAYGYAVKGVEFTYLKIADITTRTLREADGSCRTLVLYAFDGSEAGSGFLDALGGSRMEPYCTEDGCRYFTSDTLIGGLSAALSTNATVTKNAMEELVKNSGGTAMPETDEYGMSRAEGLPLGLYVVAETRVPDMVTCTCSPFLLSLPTTTIDGNEWNYDVTVYPKNETGMPTLEKTVRESDDDTGRNDGSDLIGDGYEHSATASEGDVVEYQIISTLPVITSRATWLTAYTFEDRLAAGLSYNRNDVVIGFFRDASCTDQITVWDEDSGRFTVDYTDDGMTVAMTEAGLEEINSSRAVYSPADSLQDGYSGCTMRITYACTLHSDDSLLCGDSHNDNTVELIWKRTSTEYYDRLDDDCHVYSYGIDLLKQFSDGLGDFENVKFKIRNDTDKYYVVAQLNEDGVYYVTGHADSRADATVFVPVDGHVIVRGMEDDAYTVTEIESDDGYSLLKDPIRIVISTEETGEYCPVCHRAFLTASATVNGESAEMTEDHAVLPFTVVNTPEFELPKTGSYGTWMYTAGGLAAACAGAALLLKGRKRGKDSE